MVFNLCRSLLIESGQCSRQIENRELANHNEDQGLKHLNMVEKFRKLNTCRLCFAKCNNIEELKTHEDVHIEHQDELNIPHFTLKDLKFPCDMCPQIPGFLSENVLASHKFSQHRIQDPERLVKCHVCDKMLQNVHICEVFI